MAVWKIATVLAALAVAASADSVLDWGDSDFEAGVAAQETALVMFYAPW